METGLSIEMCCASPVRYYLSVLMLFRKSFTEFSFVSFKDFIFTLMRRHGFQSIVFSPEPENVDLFSANQLTHAAPNEDIEDPGGFIHAWRQNQTQVRRISFTYSPIGGAFGIKMTIDLDRQIISLDKHDGVSSDIIERILHHTFGSSIQEVTEDQGPIRVSSTYSLDDPLPTNPEDIDRELEHWLPRQDEGQPGSDWWERVGLRIANLERKRQLYGDSKTQSKHSLRWGVIAIISLFGLIIAGLTLYIQWPRVVNDVSVSIVDYELSPEPQELSTDILIANDGNQEETFTKIAFILPWVPVEGYVGIETEHSVGQLIIKPGERILQHLVFKIPPEPEDENKKFDGRICLVCDFVGPYGRRRLGFSDFVCPFSFDRNDESGSVFRVTLDHDAVLEVYEREELYSEVVEVTTIATDGEEPVPIFSPKE